MSEPDRNVDLPTRDITRFPRDLVRPARTAWAGRARAEYRSIRRAARFLTEAQGWGAWRAGEATAPAAPGPT